MPHGIEHRLHDGRRVSDKIYGCVLAPWFAGVRLAVLHWGQGLRDLVGAAIASWGLTVAWVNFNLFHG